MESEKVPRSFGCFPHRSLRLSLTRSRSTKSSTNSATSSPRNTPKSPLKCPVRSKEDEYREVFRRFDNDNDGKISAAELRSYFGSVREYMSHEEAQSIIGYLDTDGDGLVDFQDFLRLVTRKNNGDGDEDEDLKAAFETFEMHKGCGRITAKSLQDVLGRLGSNRSYEECVAMIGVYDSEGKGELHFHDFRLMMTA